MSNSIVKDWEKYCKRIEDYSEEDYIPNSWCFNNNEKVKKLCESNPFFNSITIEWSEDSSKKESLDLTKLLDKMCWHWFENCSSTMEVLIKIENDEILIFKEKEKEISQLLKSDKEIKEKFVELIIFYFDKNPKFRFDW